MPKPTKGPRLGGSPSHQRLILANLARQIIENGAIRTTETRAKRVQPVVERLISKGKRGDLHARRQILKVVRSREIAYILCEELGPRYADRNGGYTRITKLPARKGDNAPMALIELVTEEVKPKAKKSVAPESATDAKPDPEETDVVAEDAEGADEAAAEDAAAEDAAADEMAADLDSEEADANPGPAETEEAEEEAEEK